MSEEQLKSMNEEKTREVIQGKLRYNLFAELGVISSVLVKPIYMADAVAKLAPADFFSDDYSSLFLVMSEIYNEFGKIDPILIIEKLKGKKNSAALEEALMSAINGTPNTVNFDLYVKIVKECSLMRKIFDIGNKLIAMSSSVEDPRQILDSAERMLVQLAFSDEYKIVSVADSCASELEKLKNDKKYNINNGVLSGYGGLDEILSGFRASEVTVVAARPGVGKTAFAISLSLNMSLKSNTKALFFSLEMSSKQIMLRMLSNMSEVSFTNLKSDILADEEINKLELAIGYLKQVNIYLVDTPNMNFMDIKNISRTLFLKNGIDVIFIDYIQLVDISGRFENRQSELSRISKEIKSLARELNIPIVVLSQLSRAAELSRDRKPLLWHLKSSGSIEEHFDNILFLYRSDYYYDNEFSQNNASAKIDKTEVIVAKQRNGPTGSAFVHFMPFFSKFVDC